MSAARAPGARATVPIARIKPFKENFIFIPPFCHGFLNCVQFCISKSGASRFRNDVAEPSFAQGRQNQGRHKAEAATRQSTAAAERSEEHTSELQSLMRNSYAVLCFKKKKNKQIQVTHQLLGTHKTKKYTSNNTYNTHQYRLV